MGMMRADTRAIVIAYVFRRVSGTSLGIRHQFRGLVRVKLKKIQEGVRKEAYLKDNAPLEDKE